MFDIDFRALTRFDPPAIMFGLLNMTFCESTSRQINRYPLLLANMHLADPQIKRARRIFDRLAELSWLLVKDIAEVIPPYVLTAYVVQTLLYCTCLCAFSGKYVVFWYSNHQRISKSSYYLMWL